MAKIAPSILSADFSELGRQVSVVEEAGADLVHVDVMDGSFVPNISFGAPVMKCLCGKTGMPFDVHLMIDDPDRYIKDFVTDQTEYITVHQEACVHLDRTLDYIKSLGVKAGVALNPATTVDSVEWVLEKADLVLIMSVNPGFGGQKFIGYTLDKVKKLAEERDKRGLSFEIEIDGGAGLDNIDSIIDSGTDIVVAGSSVFKSDDPAETVRKMKNR
ncbi:MAG: ribulose-phosphate 3-epimerase [Firmicutes bacterium]|nr:ribulose-phosphate 3-epimerase [Bacillota bacterium]